MPALSADPVTGADGDDWWCSASVKQGCAYLSDKLRLWGCDDPCDLEALKNVLQTYNSGPGWHAYALSNGGRWSEDLARSYGIGTPNYPLRVLEHYEVSYGASGDGAAVAEWVKARENKWLVYSPGCEPARGSRQDGRHRLLGHVQGGST